MSTGNEADRSKNRRRDEPYSLYSQVELCGGNTGVFLSSLNFNVFFVQQKKISKTKIPLYLDKHGESIKENSNSIHNGFEINEVQLKKAKKIFYNNDFIFD